MGVVATARFWRAISSVCFVAFLLAWALEGFDRVPGWGWLALIASGVAFAVELAFVAAERKRSPRR